VHSTMFTMSYGNTFTMRFESNTDLKRERVAIEKFVSRFGGTFKKLGPNDVDYRVYDKSGELIAYAEVKGRYRDIDTAYPLPVAARKVVKLCDKRRGDVRWGGRKPRAGAVNDEELMIYYDKQKEFRYIKYY